MEKKSAQRIIGILVAIALVVILLPLLIDKNNAVATQATVVKAPPFPDEKAQPAGQAAAAEGSVSAQPATDSASASSASSTIDITPEIASKVNGLAIPERQENSAQPAEPSNTPIPDAAAPATPVAANVASPSATEAMTPIAASSEPEPESVATEAEAEPVKVSPLPPVVKKLSKTNKTIKQKNIKSAAGHSAKSIEKLNTTAWVVQMGSFRDKSNARRLADKLRAAGYKAFLKDIRSAKSTQTRVFIGPEERQASAAKLSLQVAQQMKMQGILVKYKPLEI